MSRTTKEKRPYGFAAREIDGIVLRKTEEIPEGVQALYYKGNLLKVCRIGEPVVGLICDAITLNPKDYEVVLKCHLERKQKERARRFHDTRVRTPSQTDVEKVLRQGRQLGMKN